MGCGMSMGGQRNGLMALKDFQDEEAVFVQEERTRWERTKDWVGALDDVPEEDLIGSKVQLGTWLCREMDKVLDKGEKLSKGKNSMQSDGTVIAQDDRTSANRRHAVQEEMEYLMSNQERLMSMLFRVDALRYQEYVQLNTGKLRWREAVQGGNQGVKRQGSVRGNARTIMFSVMKASRAAMDGEKDEKQQASRLQDKDNSPEEWPKSEDGSSSSGKRASDAADEEEQRSEHSGEIVTQLAAATEGQQEREEQGQPVEVINRETQDAFARLQLCMGARKNLRKEFNMMDSREEKTITMNEFLFACYAMGTGLNKREITLVFKFIDTRGQGELSFDEFMAAFNLKSRLVRRMSQMEEAAVNAMLVNTHQHSSMPGMVQKKLSGHQGKDGKRRSFSMPTGSTLKLQLEHAAMLEAGGEGGEGGGGAEQLERSATTATLEGSHRNAHAHQHALAENGVIRQSY